MPFSLLLLILLLLPVVIAVVVAWKLNFSDFVVYLQQGNSTMSSERKGIMTFNLAQYGSVNNLPPKEASKRAFTCHMSWDMTLN